MKFTLLLALMLPLQAAVYVDLSGPWRFSLSDDPGYSQPDFDDRSWTLKDVPVGERSRPGGAPPTFWLRRTVHLDLSGNSDPLALTIGAIGESYQVFVNGTRIGAVGLEDSATYQLARPRTFPLPAGLKGPAIVVAIRVSRLERWGAYWRGLIIPDTGPWQITPASLAPRNLAAAAINARKVERLADVVQPVIVLVLSVIVFVIWAYQRSQTELFWLGAYLVAVGMGRLSNFAQLTTEGFPPTTGAWGQFLLLTTMPGVLLAQFAWSSLHFRWFTWPVWAVVPIGSVIHAFAVGGDRDPYPLWVIDTVTLIGLALACLPRFQAGPWRGRPRLVLVAAIALLLHTHASGWGSIERLGLPAISLITWPFTFSAHVMTVTLFAFGFSLVLVRRLLQDRDEKLRLTSELEAARSVQQLLMPASDLHGSALQFDAVYEPAQTVGGDFYFVKQSDSGGLLVVVGDVSGKGLKAAMVVSMIVGALHNRRSDEPVALMKEVNKVLTGRLDGGFVTCLIARLEPDGAARLCNAGHLAPYCNGQEVIVGQGLPLGIDASADYDETPLPGEGQLTLVSDGVVEAANAAGELFGFDRTAAIAAKPAKDIAAAAQAWGQNDDITVVTVRRNA